MVTIVDTSSHKIIRLEKHLNVKHIIWTALNNNKVYTEQTDSKAVGKVIY